MKKPTNESHIRFVSQYYGQTICYDARHPDEKEYGKIDAFIIERIENKSPNHVLELTPLQNISIEDAMSVAKMSLNKDYEGLKITNLFVKNGIIKYDVCFDFFEDCDKEIELDENLLSVHQGQYLQSKSYAIDYFCPIENRIIPVKEQIYNKWITLKTE
jgi:hypothetical protein